MEFCLRCLKHILKLCNGKYILQDPDYVFYYDSEEMLLINISSKLTFNW